MVKYKRGKYKKVDKVCEICDKHFKGTERARFCSSGCRVKAFRAKKKKS